MGKRDFDETQMDTVLADDIDCKGKLKFKNKLMIKGNFEGDIQTDEGHLFIGRKAKILSNSLKVATVSNRGKIFGNIEAKKSIEQYKDSYIEGDIVTPDLYIESGSIFNGHCTMIKKGDE